MGVCVGAGVVELREGVRVQAAKHHGAAFAWQQPNQPGLIAQIGKAHTRRRWGCTP
jgi:hypothetical protein